MPNKIFKLTNSKTACKSHRIYRYFHIISRNLIDIAF